MLGISKIQAADGNVSVALDYYEATIERGIGEDHPVVRHEMTPAQAQAYYSEAGHAPAAMVGSGREALGFGDRYDPVAFRALLEGKNPRTGEALRTGPGRPSTVAAYDLTFSAPKSVSILFAGVSDETVREAVIEAHQAAVGEGFAHLERVAATSRKGRTFTDDTGAQIYKQHTIGSEGFLAAGFEHFTSRAGDPQIHTHLITANRILSETGEWLAVDGKALYRHAKEAGVVYQAALRAQLVERLGVEFGPVRNGQADLVAIPAEVRHAFSERRAEIEAALEVWQRQHPDKEVTKAVETYLAQQTRQPKAYPTGERAASRVMRDYSIGGDVEAHWDQRIRTVGDRLGMDLVEVLDAVVGEGRPVQVPVPGRVDAVASRIVAAMDETHATWGAPDLTSRVADELFRNGGTAQDLMLATQRVLAVAESRGDVIRMLVPATDAPLPDGVTLTPEEKSVLDVRVGWVDGSGEGARFRGVPGEARYTTRAQLQHEITFMDAVSERATAPQPTAGSLEAAIRDRGLVAQQANAVRSVTRCDGLVLLLQAPAGSGKTYTIGAYADAVQTSGGTVIGVAKSAAATAKLRDDMPARTYVETIDKLRFDTIVNPQDGLRTGTVIVVDEASMVGSADWAWLVEQAQAVDGRLIAVGDVEQLPSVDPGGLFHRAVREHTGSDIVVTDLEGLNMRQRAAVDQRMLADYRAGNVTAAVVDLHDRGKVVLTDSHAEARLATVRGWWADAQSHGMAAVRMVTNTRDDVAALNALAKTEAIAAGHIDTAAPASAARDGQELHIGDRIVTRENAPGLKDTRNGDLATITAIDTDGRIEVHRDRDSAAVTLPRRYVAESVDLGYATTRHQAQGATYEATHALHGHGASHEGGYVALSRSRGDTVLYVAEERTPAGECAHHLPTDRTDTLGALADDLARSNLDPTATEHGIAVSTRSNAELVAWQHELAGQLRASPLGTDQTTDIRAIEEALQRRPPSAQARELEQQLQQLHTVRATRIEWLTENASSVAIYQAISRELGDRHHTLTAINQLDPPAEILTVVGPKAASPGHQAQWLRAVAAYSKDVIAVGAGRDLHLLDDPRATEWRNAAQRYQNLTRTSPQLTPARVPARTLWWSSDGRLRA